MPRTHPINLELKPHKPETKSVKILSAYIRARLKDCCARRSVCYCLYEEFGGSRYDKRVEESDWNSSAKPTRSDARLPEHRQACETLFSISYQDNLRRFPYLAWTNDVLKTSLKQLRIALPEQHNKVNFVKTLLEADKARSFRFMDLPPELRSMVYELALQIPAEGSHDTSLYLDDMIMPAILQTCRQIREEGTAIFYRNNRFFLIGNEDTIDRSEPQTSAWLQDHVGTQNVQDLRYITIVASCCGFHKTHLVDIDLHCRDPSTWVVRVHMWLRHRLECEQYTGLPSFALMEQRKGYKILLPARRQNSEIVNASIATASEAIDKLWETCGHGSHLRVTITALSDLSDAVRKILQDLHKK